MKTPIYAVLMIASAILYISGSKNAAAQDGSYDTDCAVILCMAGGWPVVTECNRAFDYMIERITDHPPKPPFGVCSMSDGSGYENYNLDYSVGSIQSRSSYYCPDGTYLHTSEGNQIGSITAFCYIRKDRDFATDGTCYENYQGITAATYRKFRANLTVEPGTNSEWKSPETLIETLVPPPERFQEPCYSQVSETPNGGFTVPPMTSSCLTSLISPSNSEICNGRWSAVEVEGGNPAHGRRASCARTSDGETVLAMSVNNGEPASLNQMLISAPAGRSYNSVRASVEFMIPDDYKVFDSGGLAFGVLIGDVTSSTNGGDPDRQKGAMVRAQFKNAANGSITLENYSYHLDGNGTKTATWGTGRDMAQPIPKGQWITLTYDVTLNDPGKANGSSILTAYDSAGNVIGVAAFNGVTYRPDSTWKFNGLSMTEKFSNPLANIPTQSQSMFYRNFKLQGGNATAPECSG